MASSAAGRIRSIRSTGSGQGGDESWRPTEFASSQARTAEDLNGLMRLMMKSALERMLNTELDVHLGRRSSSQAALAESPSDEAPVASKPVPASPAKLPKRAPNRRNGKSAKTVQGDLGELTIETPRDRDGTFEPQLIPKHQRRMPGFDEKILARYTKPRLQHVIDGMRARRLDKRLSKATRAKMSVVHKQRGTRPPWLNQPWEPWEDELCRTLRVADVADRTGRTIEAVKSRRKALRLPDGRTRSERKKAWRSR